LAKIYIMRPKNVLREHVCENGFVLFIATCPFFFSGLIIVYAVSGIMLNHRDSINPNYTVKLHQLQVDGTFPMAKEDVSKSMVIDMLKLIKEDKNYTKHYFPENDKLKVFLKGGSSLEVDMQSGKAFYESLKKRPIISQFNRLHYNPGKWWTLFSDIFAVSLINYHDYRDNSSSKAKKASWDEAASNCWQGSLW